MGIAGPAAARTPPAGDPVLIVPAPRDGWVTQASGGRMLAALPPGTTVRLETRAGAYLHGGEPLATVWPVPADPQQVLRRLSATVLIADSRTMQRDVDFALRQLVDIGLRALSAAINDPTTAVEVTLRVGSVLRRLLIPASGRGGGRAGRPAAATPWELSPEEYIAHGFDQLRCAAPTQPQVAGALLRVLRMLIAHVDHGGRAEHTPALRRQIDLLHDALRAASDLHRADLARLEAMAIDADPADHSSRWAPAESAGAARRSMNGHRAPSGAS